MTRAFIIHSECEGCSKQASLALKDEFLIPVCETHGYIRQFNVGGTAIMDGQELKTGQKKDEGKPRYELLPWDAIEEVVRVLTAGAIKYEARNWEKGISYGRVMGAGWRHDTKFWMAKLKGENEIDPETFCHHMAESICERLFVLAYELRGMKAFDDRPTR